MYFRTCDRRRCSLEAAEVESRILSEIRSCDGISAEDSEMEANVPNIVDHTESQTVDCEVATDCSSNESEDDTVFSDYDSEDLESDTKRLRYMCEVGCPFVCLISEDKNGGGVKIKTLKSKHKCNPAYDNARIDFNTIAEYFKNKLQENPIIKVKEMRVALKTTFNINVSHAKCKRAKRMILESLAGSFTNEYNKIEAYANELRLRNPGSDEIITLSKDALAEGNRIFSRMYICFHALKIGFKSGLKPFIGLDRTLLERKAKGHLDLVLIIVEQFIRPQSGEGYTFMLDTQKGVIEAVQRVVPDAHHKYYVRHIEANWCRRWGAGNLKKYVTTPIPLRKMSRWHPVSKTR
ncbi:PREDICTED: uncharacterized protein LOC109231726 [Nicotiana attenuata]|uniref:uncharacterized protein LOC109231726 n=1 Tax=Nicotiana attenuata TaxID=49451 RepID=UPI0009053EBD|nr:PREDICTED: uncharacterized protein LOC109231726 [Nicotiana attenuata]